MPVLDDGCSDYGGDASGVVVPGLYTELLERERRNCIKPDPRRMKRLHPEGGYCTTSGKVCDHDQLPIPRSQLLDDLKAGRPIRLQGRQLRGHSLPDTRLRREQAFNWFDVGADDTVRLAVLSE